jgi:hypothetical protein
MMEERGEEEGRPCGKGDAQYADREGAYREKGRRAN